MVNSDLVAALQAGLAERADPAKAPGMQAYMKSSMPYWGVTSPIQQGLYREVLSMHPIGTFDDWRDTVLALWHQASFREERYAALAVVGYRRYLPFRTLAAVPLYAELIVSGAWWDLIDGLATHEVGDLLRRFPEEMRPMLLGWSRDSDPWLRRASIICQVGFKGTTDQDLLYACIEPNLAERGFFLRKAIGWALREYAKAAPDAVWRYVAEHEHELSGLSKREARKHLAHLQNRAASA